MKYKDISEKEKAAVALFKEQGELYAKKFKRPSIPLDKPYQKGWKRYFKVRKDIAASPFGKLAAQILKTINRTDYSSREDFKKKSGKSKKLVEIKVGLRKIPIREWEHNKYPEDWKTLFSPRQNRYGWIEYHFNKPWWFEAVIEKHMITHYYEADAELDERLKEVKQIIEFNNLMPVYFGMKGGSGHRFLDPDARIKHLRDEARKEIRDNL